MLRYVFICYSSPLEFSLHTDMTFLYLILSLLTRGGLNTK